MCFVYINQLKSFKRVVPKPVRRVVKKVLERLKRRQTLKIYEILYSLPFMHKKISQGQIFKIKGLHCFFGYYDITPFNHDDTLLLAMTVDAPLASTDGKHKAKTGYFDLKGKKFNFLGETDTWCWQQGCRLQWYPQNAATSLIFYNRSSNNIYGGVIQDVFTKKIIKEIPIPLYEISKNGTKGLSLDFLKLQECRPGYGYVNVFGKRAHEDVEKEEGIWLYDFETGSIKMILAMGEVVQIEKKDSMENAVHYFNHLSFNPSGNRFMVFHLWLKDNKRYSRLIISDISGEKMKILNNSGIVSHYTWKNNDELLVYCKFNKSLAYILYDIGKNTARIVGKNKLTIDGHPSYTKNGKYIVTDTYPDNRGIQKLIAFDVENEAIKVISTHFKPDYFTGEVRCDLHPRLSRDNNFICVDDVFGSKRVMKIIKSKFC